MAVVETEKALRVVQSLPFCYLCGTPVKIEPANGDHVFSKKSWDIPERRAPLILSAHVRCNTAKSNDDEVLSQLLWAGRGRYPAAATQRVIPETFNVIGTTKPLVAIHNELTAQAWRWVQGCHSALYREFLDIARSQRAVSLPLRAATVSGDVITPEPLQAQQLVFVDLIKRNRWAKCLDRLRCNNDRCCFECVWIQFEDGRWGCVFALTVDGWEDLARTDLHPRQGCVGFYKPPSGPPRRGSKECRLVFSPPNADPLDPFGQ